MLDDSRLTRRPGSTRKHPEAELPMHAPGMYPRGHEPTAGDGVSTVTHGSRSPRASCIICGCPIWDLLCVSAPV
eukprot:1322184-Prymnesium_polylepis.1